MKSKRLVAQVAALGTLGLWVAGCTTDPPSELTEGEAMTIAELMGGTVVDPALEETEPHLVCNLLYTWCAFHEKAGGPTYETEVDCPEGGTAALSGTVDMQLDDSSFSASSEGSGDLDSCAGRTDEDVVIALTGGIEFAVTTIGTLSLADRMVYIRRVGGAEGSLEVADEGESRVCEVDVALDVEWEFEVSDDSEIVKEGGMTGSVCGHIVDFDAADLEFCTDAHDDHGDPGAMTQDSSPSLPRYSTRNMRG